MFFLRQLKDGLKVLISLLNQQVKFSYWGKNSLACYWSIQN